jgi:hypothetical protein
MWFETARMFIHDQKAGDLPSFAAARNPPTSHLDARISMLRQPLITKFFTADPSAHAFEGKVFIYPSHDLDLDNVTDNDEGDQYQMTDYRVLCQERPDAPARDCGEALHLKDVPWASRQMWAPDAAYRDGRYYLYFPARDKAGVFRIGVAVSSNPAGPFMPEAQPIKGSYSIDPCVLPDDDGEFYMYFGGLWGGQLECWTSGSFVAGSKPLNNGQTALGPRVARLRRDMLQFDALPQEVIILDEQGKPLKASDTVRRYFEGPWVHKYKGVYYLSYSTGETHTLVYATGASPFGPFTFRGRILNPVVGWTTHHSIVEFGGKWCLYYHDSSLSGGVNHKRCVKVQELFYEADGSIRTMDP